jgi:hypothetical protein
MSQIFWNQLSRALFHSEVIGPIIKYEGALPCKLPVSELLAETTGLTAVALARLRGQAAHDVMIDARLCGLWANTSCESIGWALPEPWDPISSMFETLDGWIRLHTNAAHHKAAARAVLGDVSSKSVVAQSISQYHAKELETLFVENGGAAARLIRWEDWQTHPQGKALSRSSLVEWVQKAAPPTNRLRNADYSTDRPLSGIKVLDLTRVLAGPVATRTLAGFGAQVLRIDPDGWDDHGVLHDTTLGKRCAGLDLRVPDDRAVFDVLLTQADVLVHGYRPSALAGLGYGQHDLEAINPALIDVTLCAYGWQGPWADRRGFDSLVQLSSGIADICADANGVPGKLPVQALDHAAGYIMAACVLEALAQAKLGKVMSARTSLAAVAMMLCNKLGHAHINEVARPVEDADYMALVEHSSWGELRRLRSPMKISGAPMRWDEASGWLRRHKAQWQA